MRVELPLSERGVRRSDRERENDALIFLRRKLGVRR